MQVPSSAIETPVSVPEAAAPRGRRAPSLRAVLALALGGVALAATVTLAVLVSREATRSLETEVVAQLGEVALHLAANLDQGLFERWRDIQIAASLDTIRAPETATADKRAVLKSLQRTFPDYAIIGLVAADGRVSVTSIGVLEGVDVAHRDYFVGGREGPFVSDVHEALLLKPLVAGQAREPLRLIDLAAPVRDTDGTLVGVLMAHLNWTWAQGLADDLARSLRGHRTGAEILILGRDGTVLLGPAALQGSRLPDTLAGPGAGRTGLWPDHKADFLSASAPTRGYRDFPGLGWRVLVRQRASRALTPVAELRRNILVAGSTVALAAGLLAWFLAGWIARPLQELAEAARSLGSGGPMPRLPGSAVLREGRHIAEALATAADSLRHRDAAQRLLIDELNHRVKNTLATVQSLAVQSLKGVDAAAGRQAFEARLLALSAAHNILTQESWAGADLRGIVEAAIRPFAGAGQITVAGPTVHLPPEPALALSMMLHELCTNAVKYGALSSPGGTVAMSWQVEAGADELVFAWREAGGPEVAPPARHGFGSRLLRRGFGTGGPDAAVVAYDSDGLRFTARLPMPGR